MSRSSERTLAASLNALDPYGADDDRLWHQSQKLRATDEQKREDQDE